MLTVSSGFSADSIAVLLKTLRLSLFASFLVVK